MAAPSASFTGTAQAFTKTLDAGFIHTFDSQRNIDIAALLLALDNHFNIGTLLTSLSRAVVFSPNSSNRIVIEVDPFMVAVPPENAKFEFGQPMKPGTPEEIKACERMLMATTSYLASGGQLLSPDVFKGCFATVYPEFLATSSHGTSKKQNELLNSLVQQEHEIRNKIALKKHQAESLGMATRSLKDPEQLEKARLAYAQAAEEFNTVVKESQSELAKLEKEQEEIMKKRNEYVKDARTSLDFFSLYTLADGRKWKITQDPIFSAKEHQLTIYGLIGAALDDNMLAFTLYYHGEVEFDLGELPVDSLEFFNYWQGIRKRTVDAIASGKVPFEKIPRNTTVVHFWLNAQLFTDFIGKIFNNRAVFMQNRITERHEVLAQRKAEAKAEATDKKEEEKLASIPEDKEKPDTQEPQDSTKE